MKPALPTAVVFNCSYNGLAIIRELGHHGVPVVAMDCRRSIGTYSRYARFVNCPDPLVDEKAFIRALLDLDIGAGDRAVLIPTNDVWAAAIARAKGELSRRFAPCVADDGVVQLLLDKKRFAQWAQARGYPAPRSWSAGQLAEVPPDAYPLAAKPNCRRNASNDPRNLAQARLFDRLRLTVLKTPQDAQRFVSEQSEFATECILQEYVQGLSDCMYTVGVYADSTHQVRGMFTGRKVRGFPPDFGDCMVGESHSVPDGLKELVRRMCQDLPYEGIAEFEFKRDSESGTFTLIEVNPRSWSWIGITPACGVSLPWIAYSDLTGTPCASVAESTAADGSVKWARVLDDFRHCTSDNRLAGFPEWHMSAREWWRSLRADRMVCAEGDARDWTPAWVAFRRFLLRSPRRMASRVWRRASGRPSDRTAPAPHQE